MIGKNPLQDQNLPALLLRVGLAVVFVYAAVQSLMHPSEWVGYLPGFLIDHMSAELLLKVTSIFELILAVWLVSGVYVRYAALLSAALLAGIVLTTLDLLIVSFRDIGLVFAALALAALPEKKD